MNVFSDSAMQVAADELLLQVPPQCEMRVLRETPAERPNEYQTLVREPEGKDMRIASLNHTTGDVRRHTIDYGDFVGAGGALTSATVTSSSTTLTADNAAVLVGTLVVFFVRGGTAGETATITVTVKTRDGQTVNDTVDFTVTSL